MWFFFSEKYVLCSVQFVLSFVLSSSALNPSNTAAVGTTASELQRFFCCFKLVRVEKWAARAPVSVLEKTDKCFGLTSLSAHEQTRLNSCKALRTICHSYYFSPNSLLFFFLPFLTISIILVHRGYGDRYLCTDTLTWPQGSYYWKQQDALGWLLCTGFWSFRFTQRGVS